MSFTEAIGKQENRLKALLLGAAFIIAACLIGRMVPSRPFFALLFPLYAITLYLLFFKPAVILMIVVLLTSTVFTLDAFPQPITIGRAGLFLPEVLVLLLWMRTLPALLLKRDLKRLASPVTLPVLLFGIWIAFSVANAIISQKSSFIESVLIGRGYIYYFNFLLILYYLDNRHKATVFLGVMTAAAAVCSLLSFVQYILGPDVVLFPWDTWNVARVTYDETVPTLARVMPSSIALIYILFFPALSNLISGAMKRKFLYTVFVITAFLALFLSFTRNVYYSVIVGVFILWLNYKGKVGSRSVQSFVTIVLVAGLVAYLPVYFDIVKVPNWWEQISNRQEEFFAAGAQTETFAWRTIEMMRVAQEVAKSPIIGQGIGATYYHPLYGSNVAICHNGYLTILYQMGLIGLVLVGLIFFRFLYSSFGLYRKIKNEYSRNTIFGLATALLALLPAIWVKPVLVEEYFWISLLGVVWALPTVIARGCDAESEEVR
jgi:O-antigen ligase